MHTYKGNLVFGLWEDVRVPVENPHMDRENKLHAQYSSDISQSDLRIRKYSGYWNGHHRKFVGFNKKASTSKKAYKSDSVLPVLSRGVGQKSSKLF